MKDPAAKSSPPEALEAALYEAALAHLARFATTRARLALVLARRLERTERRAAEGEEAGAKDAMPREAKRAVIERVLDRLAAAGLLDDGAYAAARARRLLNRGTAPARIAADLARHGVDRALIARLTPRDMTSETLATLAYCARRRLGPFAPEGGADRAAALRALARAGFSAEAARRVLEMGRDEAEARLALARRERR
jgi:regulatory protein